MIDVFNRSHYEDVLVVRVKDLAPEQIWRPRYESINDFEQMLVREGHELVKFFLHISQDDQLDASRSGSSAPDKHWKFSANDVRERERWDDYQQAYEDALNATSTPWAPWYVVPADHKWFRDLVVARVVAATLEAMDPRYPPPPQDEVERPRARSGSTSRPAAARAGRRAPRRRAPRRRSARGSRACPRRARPPRAARRDRGPAASAASSSRAVGVVGELGRAGGDAREVAVPEAGELERVVERRRGGAALGAAGALGGLGLAPAVLLARAGTAAPRPAPPPAPRGRRRRGRARP